MLVLIRIEDEMMLIVKVVCGLVAAGSGVAFATSTGAVVPQQQPADLPAQAAVSVLADANSFDVISDGRSTRVRLANITAPLPPVAGRAAQCLGAEASGFVAKLMPVGTPLTLVYGKDRFGRALAAATTPDGRLVNAEVARAGFAEVVGGEEEAAILPAVRAAAQDAALNKRGLYSPAVGCTVPGQLKAVQALAARVPAGPAPGARGAELHVVANTATDARAAADELVWAFQQNRQDVAWRVLDVGTRADLERQAVEVRDRVAAAEVVLRNAASGAFNLEVTQTAEQKEAARVAKQQAAIRAAVARRAAEAARRAEAARQARAAAEKQSRNESRSESRRSDSDSSSSRSRDSESSSNR